MCRTHRGQLRSLSANAAKSRMSFTAIRAACGCPPALSKWCAKPPARLVYGSSVKPLLSQLAKVNGQAAQAVKAGTHSTGGARAWRNMKPASDITTAGHFPMPICMVGCPAASIRRPARNFADSAGLVRQRPGVFQLALSRMDGIGCHYCQSLFDLPAHMFCAANTTGIGWGMPDDVFTGSAVAWATTCRPGKPCLPKKTANVATATILNRSIMVSNRTGGAASVKTVGDNALVLADSDPFPAKSEFKAAMLFPYPKKRLRCRQRFRCRDGSASGMVADFFNVGSKRRTVWVPVILFGPAS